MHHSSRSFLTNNLLESTTELSAYLLHFQFTWTPCLITICEHNMENTEKLEWKLLMDVSNGDDKYHAVQHHVSYTLLFTFVSFRHRSKRDDNNKTHTDLPVRRQLMSNTDVFSTKYIQVIWSFDNSPPIIRLKSARALPLQLFIYFEHNGWVRSMHRLVCGMSAFFEFKLDLKQICVQKFYKTPEDYPWLMQIGIQ